MAVVHKELSDSIDQLVDNPDIVGLYRDWTNAERVGRLPAFELFEPERRPDLSGNLMVLVSDGETLQYAHYGRRIALATGFDMTGRRTLDYGGDLEAFEPKYRAVLESGRPLYGVGGASQISAVVSWERLILPVERTDGAAVIVCYSVPHVRKAEILDGLMDASMGGIVVMEPVVGSGQTVVDFRYLMVNRRAGVMLARDPDTLIGGLAGEVFPEAAARIPVYRRIMEDGKPRQFELETRLDDEERVFRLSAVRAGDKLVVTLSDITELRRMMDRLEQQQTELQYVNDTLQEQGANLVSLIETTEQARADALDAERFVADLMEAVPIPIFHWKLDGSLHRCNRHYAAIYGSSPADMHGKRPEDLLPSPVAGFLREQNARLLSGQDTHQTYEGSVDTAVDGRRDFVVHRALMRDPTGQPTGIAGAMLDVTDEHVLRGELELLATTDPLTGLLNRRAFMRRLEEERSRYLRYGRAGSTILIDIDHFKRVNDTLGHDAGDRVLVGVASLLRESSRDGVDAAARYGGEEFAILLPDTTLEGSAQMAERVRRRLETLAFDTPFGPYRCTASFGVAAFEPADDVGTLLKRADEALYRSKEAGRNRVTVACV